MWRLGDKILSALSDIILVAVVLVDRITCGAMQHWKELADLGIWSEY